MNEGHGSYSRMMAEEIERRRSSYERCASCNGTGLTMNTYTGEVDECYECAGNCVVRRRDALGRYSNGAKP